MLLDCSTKPVTLARVLAYRRPGVVRRYAEENGTSIAESREVFREMLKWLYLCFRATTAGPDGVACSMTRDIEKIDWMWHTFILFTYDYAAFCERYFGFFLHHFPADDGGQERLADDKALQGQLETQFGLVYDVLGRQTLKRWYEECRYAP